MSVRVLGACIMFMCVRVLVLVLVLEIVRGDTQEEGEGEDQKMALRAGVDFLPPLEPRTGHHHDSEFAKLKQELADKNAELEQVQSDLRVARFTIKQLEEENSALCRRSTLGVGKTGHKSKKKKKGGSKGKKGAGAKTGKSGSKESIHGKRSSHEKDGEGGGKKEGEATEEGHHASAEEQEVEEEVTLEMIADKVPDVRLALVVAAEKQFAGADLDGNGFLDAPELDALLTKHNQIFSQQQIESILAHIDADADDRIDFLEYITILHLLQTPGAMSQRDGEKLDEKSKAVIGSLERAVKADTAARGSKACVIQ